MSDPSTTAADGPDLLVGVWQADVPLLDVPTALELMSAAAADAAARGVRLLVCPELTLTGYDIAEHAAEVAEPPGGPMAATVADLSRRHGLAIAWSWPERDGDVVHITAELVDRGVVLARHRKAHLYGTDETAAYAPGDGTPVLAEVDGLRVGLLVCYDIEFPEQVRLVALAGADLIACPTALMEPYEAVSDLLVRARAYENQVVVAYANRVGAEHELRYCGRSRIVGADGVDLATDTDLADGPARAGLLVASVRRDDLDRARRANTHLHDRRPGLYGALTAPRSQR